MNVMHKLYYTTILNCFCRDLAHEIELIARSLQEDNPLLLDVRRTDLLNDALHEAKKKEFTVTKHVKVRFVTS